MRTLKEIRLLARDFAEARTLETRLRTVAALDEEVQLEIDTDTPEDYRIAKTHFRACLERYAGPIAVKAFDEHWDGAAVTA